MYIERIGFTSTGARWRVTSQSGEVLVERSRNPEFDACRSLLAAGFKGSLEVWHQSGGHPGLVLDIEQGAKLTVTDPDSGRPRFVPWVPEGLGQDDQEGADAQEQAVARVGFEATAAKRSRPVGKEGRRDRPLAKRSPGHFSGHQQPLRVAHTRDSTATPSVLGSHKTK